MKGDVLSPEEYSNLNLKVPYYAIIDGADPDENDPEKVLRKHLVPP